ncbi:hypothetical protein M9978_10505 [Sphingomonas sp. MG17]|uniref:Uncharacterized protein n=1 Tax=Sphingomonas tagetis TaxID=2949092 RepID=A0A9X2HS28_9SPHN|nr:hypothetical protein [Sphingomonas tagetis]MCP3730860.1 hypothetical protein [Sphingomonas tagetis]
MRSLTALVLALAALPVAAAPVLPEAVSADTAASDATIERAELVRDVIARARADKDVSMMLVAANMLRQGDFVLVPAENAPLVIGRARAGEELPVTEPAALLREAQGWAAGDPDKLAAVEAAQAEASKGIIPAAIVYTHDLPADRTLTMRARAEGGRLALVRVRGDGDSALELSVTDAQGRIACSDRPPSGTPAVARRDLSCRWTPNRTEEYRITLKNKGRVWTRAILVSN